MAGARHRVAHLALPAVVALVLAASSVGQAQNARPGPWIPVGSRLDGLVSWLIADGGFASVDPLTRPYRLAAVRRAAAQEDTTQLTPAARGSLVAVRAELAGVEDSAAASLEFGGGAWNNGRRDSFREGGQSGAGPMVGAWVSVTRGPFVVVVNPAFENRLKDDPEFTGKTDRFIAGRMQTSYVALTGERGDLVYGRFARNWGPDLFEGLQLSPSAYATDMLVGTLRVGRFELTTIAQRLDDYDSTVAVPISRYFLAHRLGIRAGKGIWIALTETGVYGGPGRGFETAFLAPLNPALLTEFNEGKNVNLTWGAELHARLGHGISFDGELMIDDIQIDRRTLQDLRPWSGGFTLVARGALPGLPVHGALGYTQVRSLTYRNSFDPDEVYAIRGVGIARNLSDYDQFLLRLETRPTGRAHLTLDASYIRQGSGDFRLPFPSDSTLATEGQGFLVAPVRQGAGVRLGGAVEATDGLLLDGEVGVNGKLGGGTVAIAALAIRVRFDLLQRRFGGPWPGVERTAASHLP